MYRKLCHLSDPPSQKKMASRNNFLIYCFEITVLKLSTYLNGQVGGWNTCWGYIAFFLGNKSNQSKSKKAEMGTTCLLQQICKNKTKKNFTRARTRTIDNSVAVRQCPGSSTPCLLYTSPSPRD